MMPKALKERHHRASDLLARVAAHGPAWVADLGRASALAETAEASSHAEPTQIQQWLYGLAIQVDHRLVDFQEAVEERLACAERLRRLRPQRDRAMQELYDLVVAQRSALRLVGGADLSESLFGSGPTPTNPWVLASWSREYLAGLAELMPRGDIGNEWLSVDVPTFADELEAKLAALESSLREIASAEAAEEAAVVRKDETQSLFDQTFQEVSKIVKGLAGLAAA